MTIISEPAVPALVTVTTGDTAAIVNTAFTTIVQNPNAPPAERTSIAYTGQVSLAPANVAATNAQSSAAAGASTSNTAESTATNRGSSSANRVTQAVPTTLVVYGSNPGSSNSTISCPESVFGTNTIASPQTVFTPAVCVVTPNGQPVETNAATATATSSGGSQPSQTNKPGGLTPGATAGAAIGAAIGAAVIAFLLTFFLCVRKRRSNHRGGVYMTEKPSPAHAWDAFLPQSADDGTIQRSVNALYSQIDMHVENYYGSNAMAGLSTESRAALQNVDGGILPRSVEELMRETTTPLPVIKHCFAWMILSRLSPAAHSESSLLPPELARMPPKLSGSKGRSDREEKAMDQAYPYWRVLTAHLLYPRSSNASQNMTSQGTAEVLAMLSTAFQPWSKNVKSGAPAPEHLSSVLKTATETGLSIMSQPSTFGFEWDVLDTARAAPGTASSTVVVLPAFEKTADERGETLAQRYVLTKPKVEAISL